jgi:hypothetical protein
MSTIALDFDGVVNSYKSGYIENRLPDPPVEGALDFIRSVQDAGYRVAIHTTRATTPAAVDLIRWYLKAHGLEESRADKVLISLKPKAMVYIDDRAYRFTGSWPSLGEVKMLGDSPGRSVEVSSSKAQPAVPDVEEVEDTEPPPPDAATPPDEHGIPGFHVEPEPVVAGDAPPDEPSSGFEPTRKRRQSSLVSSGGSASRRGRGST